jgi:predicted HTH transcriptional regulator
MRQMADTSIEAYEYLKTNNLLTQRQQEVFNCLKANGIMTAKQIARKLNKPLNTISGRITELINMGMVKVVGRIKEDGARTSSRQLQAVNKGL